MAITANIRGEMVEPITLITEVLDLTITEAREEKEVSEGTAQGQIYSSIRETNLIRNLCKSGYT